MKSSVGAFSSEWRQQFAQQVAQDQPSTSRSVRPSEVKDTDKQLPNQVDAIYLQMSVMTAVRILIQGSIRSKREWTGNHNESEDFYPGVMGMVGWSWLRGKPLFDVDVPPQYEVLLKVEEEDDMDHKGRVWSYMPQVTLVLSTALLDRKDYHITIGPDSMSGAVTGMNTYGPRHINKIIPKVFGNSIYMGTIVFHHAVPNEYIQEIWLHGSVPPYNNNLAEVEQYVDMQETLLANFTRALQEARVQSKYQDLVRIDRFEYPTNKFTARPSNHTELLAIARTKTPNFCFSGTANQLTSRLSLIEMKKMAIDCGFTYDDVSGIEEPRQLAQLIHDRSNQLFHGEGTVSAQVFDPPFGGANADEPFDRQFIVELLGQKMFARQVAERESLLVDREELKQLLDKAKNGKVDLLAAVRNTYERAVDGALPGAVIQSDSLEPTTSTTTKSKASRVSMTYD
jgi:hypothetical protein